MGTTKLPTPIRPKKANGERQNVYWIRKKVPDRYRALVGKTEIWRSLGTANLRDANARIGKVSAEIEAEWARLADEANTAAAPAGTVVEPPAPSHRDLHALRAVVHIATRDRVIHNPTGFSAMRLAAAIHDPDNSDDMEALDDAVREFLKREGFSATDAAVARFAPLFVQAHLDAVSDLRRAAAGDYSDNPVLAKLPARTTPKLDLLQAFEEYTEKGGLKGGKFGPTAKRWRPKIKAFCRWLGHRDLARMTTADGYRWADHLKAEKYADESIRNVWIASLSATAGFMVERRRLAQNPFSGVRVRDGANTENQPPRKKGYTRREAEAILAATLDGRSPLISEETAAARRWLPWLCAYSGARVNELTSLYPDDVTRDPETGIWCMQIKPELEKTDQWRTVPIHSHVIEQGFLEYVERRRKAGLPLFYDPARGRGGSAGNPQFKKVAERLAEWLHSRKLIPAGVRPNHAWRHLFKSLARHLKFDREVEGFITGHRPKGGASIDYGDRWVETLAAEIEKYPRYDIAALNAPPAPHKRVRRTRAQIEVDGGAKAARKARRATRAPDGGVVAT